MAAVPTLIAATGALFYAYKEEQSEFGKGVTDTTRALALVVDREIARREAIALTLAGSPTLTRGDLRGFHEYASNIAPTRDKVVTLQDLSGQQLVNTRLPFGSALPMSRISKEREAAGPTATVVSNLYFAPVGKQFSFGVQVPVARDGVVRYYLSVAGFASGLQPIMEDQRLPEGWVASILDRKGVVVARNRDPERFVGKPTSPRLAAQLAQGAEGVFESTTIDGIPILATFSRSPGYGWTVVIGVPLSRATAPLKVVAGFGALATLLLLLTVLAALWTGRRLLGPVERLKAASEALGSGRSP
ncbi:MAG TPA: hybrid sensor histidine kinase/response regulator, partial [Rubrivivax sp.]|nr:hybrid sensor histidine kinase/response regulator [Rubrivivax sp.]